MLLLRYAAMPERALRYAHIAMPVYADIDADAMPRLRFAMLPCCHGASLRRRFSAAAAYVAFADDTRHFRHTCSLDIRAIRYTPRHTPAGAATLMLFF